MRIVEVLFWINLLFLLYVYGGYVLFTLLFKRQREVVDPSFKPKCTLLIAAYNEEKVIERKIQNSLELDYPERQLEIIIVADGSTDQTAEIVSRYPLVKLFYQPERKGKLAAIQRVLPAVQSEIVVFTDANTFLNGSALNMLVPHFADATVGGVSGEKKVSNLPTSTGTEGIYWKYESWLKQKDSEFYSVVGAAGELFAIRASLYTTIEENLVLDDFIQSMLICNQGYRVVYEQMAVATELPSQTLKDEFSRKVRITSGGFQAIHYLKNKMNFHKFPALSFLYFSHRVFRWMPAPVCFFLLLPLNLWIVLLGGNLLYETILVIQVLMYMIALAGRPFSISGKTAKLVSVIHYFLLMQIAAIAGLFKFKRAGHSAIWEKLPRN